MVTEPVPVLPICSVDEVVQACLLVRRVRQPENLSFARADFVAIVLAYTAR